MLKLEKAMKYPSLFKRLIGLSLETFNETMNVLEKA